MKSRTASLVGKGRLLIRVMMEERAAIIARNLKETLDIW